MLRSTVHIQGISTFWSPMHQWGMSEKEQCSCCSQFVQNPSFQYDLEQKMHGMQQAIWLISREIANFSNVSRWYRKIWYRVSLCFPYIDLCPCSSPPPHESSYEVCSLTKHRAAWSLCLLFFAFLIGFYWLFFKHHSVKSICSGVNHVTSWCLCKHFFQFAALLPRYFPKVLSRANQWHGCPLGWSVGGKEILIKPKASGWLHWSCFSWCSQDDKMKLCCSF